MEQPYGHDGVAAAAEGGVGGTGSMPVGHVAAAEHPIQGHAAPEGGGVTGDGIVVDNSNMYNVPGGVAAPSPPVAPHPQAHLHQHHPIAPAGLVVGGGGGSGGSGNPPGQAFAYDPTMHQQLQHHPESNGYSMPNGMPGMVSAPVPTSGAVDAMHHPVGGQAEAAGATNATGASGKKKRLCRVEGCQRVIKSQGLCQRHGASAKRCKVQGCDKQAQGTHDGMCKRHWKEINNPDSAKTKGNPPPPPEGESVYESVLPASISYRPTVITPVVKANKVQANPGNGSVAPSGDNGSRSREISVTTDALGELNAPEGINIMPLVQFLREGREKPFGWHRNQERRSRGMFPCTSLSMQLEPSERQLALVEILLLSGGTPHANFKDLAHAWGREKGFHTIITNNVCHRKGEVERKRRSDVGRVLSTSEREAFKTKMNQTKRHRREGWEPQEYHVREQPIQQQPHIMPMMQGQHHNQPPPPPPPPLQPGHQNMVQYAQQSVVDAGAAAVAAAAAAAAAGGGPLNLQEDNTAEV
mmetsp:Transcript_18752/g.45265  ORF Transcript_18752/g.45265 Transcript_18752/m.45265 type:complete len:526 (+) Transcript_18752:147-1724(+)